MGSQEKIAAQSESLPSNRDNSRGTGIVFFSISIFAHGLFFMGMVFLQEFKIPKPMPSVIQIDLVSFSPEPVFEEPAKSEVDSKKEGLPLNPEPSIKKSQKIPTIKPEISLKTKPKNLKDLMARQKKKKEPEKKPVKEKEKKPVEKKDPKKQITPEKDVETPGETIEKKSEDQTQDKIAQALSRLQKKVTVQGKTKNDQVKGSSGGAGKRGYTPLDLYKMVIGSAIQQNWVFNETLAKMDQNLEVRILVKILKSGEIRDIIYETRSENRYLDESAKKAIKKANPLPPLPSGRYSYDVLIGFTPKGLK